jgi:hypothetical protein
MQKYGQIRLMKDSKNIRPLVQKRSEILFVPRTPPQLRGEIQALWPNAQTSVIDALATIWDEVLHEVICGILNGDDSSAPIHFNLREEMIAQLASLQLFIGKAIVSKRLDGRDPASIDAAKERVECFNASGRLLIDGTAKEFSEKFWLEKMNQRWIPRSTKMLERESNPRPRKLSVKNVDKNHFIPRWFIRDLWATNGKIMRWRHTNGEWKSKTCGLGNWGYRKNLYSNKLEAYFGMIEGDAKKPIEDLMKMVPLNGPNREAFIAFLVIHVLRSPFFADRIKTTMVLKIAQLGYTDDPEMPQKAYESLFTNNALYNDLAHPLMSSRWALVRAKNPVFVLPDTFSAYGKIEDGFRLLAPLSPTLCFVALPKTETEKRIVPLTHIASDSLAHSLSDLFVSCSVTEFLCHPDFHPAEPRQSFSFESILECIEAEIGEKT